MGFNVTLRIIWRRTLRAIWHGRSSANSLAPVAEIRLRVGPSITEQHRRPTWRSYFESRIAADRRASKASTTDATFLAGCIESDLGALSEQWAARTRRAPRPSASSFALPVWSCRWLRQTAESNHDNSGTNSGTNTLGARAFRSLGRDDCLGRIQADCQIAKRPANLITICVTLPQRRRNASIALRPSVTTRLCLDRWFRLR